MRILLLSDIHSNLEALNSCLAAAPAHDVVVNLGDIVGYGANPNEVTERVRKLGESFVRGNHDKVVSGVEAGEDFNPMAAGAALWNRSQLGGTNLEWLRALPKGPIVLSELPEVQFVHGAPSNEDRYVLMPEDAAQEFGASSVGVTFFGHTHVQGAFVLRSGIVEEVRPAYNSSDKHANWDLRLQPGSRCMINPGSVGQPRDDDWRAAFAVLDSDQGTVSFVRAPYDLRSAQEKILNAKLPPRLATRLAAGR